MKRYIYFIIFTLSIVVHAQKKYPIPPKSNNRLFYIQHNENKNTYVYDANFASKGVLDVNNPVDIYRVLYAENGEKKPLTIMQKKLAYGVNVTNIRKNEFQVSLVSFPKQKFILKLDTRQIPYVETVVNNKTIKLNRVFIKQKNGTSGINVKIDYIIFYGTDNKGNMVEEKIFFKN